MFPTTTPEPLLRALSDKGYEAPTPVQALVVEAPPQRDLLVSARTGSGKTVAFGLAFAADVLREEAPREGEAAPRGQGPRALVIAPTRELALQVARELDWLYGRVSHRGPVVATCVGGTDARREARALDAGPLLVVGTPGRLCDHLSRGRLDLSGLRAVVLDEADEMLDMGFREELETLLDAAPAERRTLLFSATLPKGIEALAARYQKDAVRIAANDPRERHADIAYEALLVAGREIEHAVVNLLRVKDAPNAIVFCATREAVNRLSASLHERGFSAVALSGELTQAERTRALQALRDGRARVLVATDVAARGLDLPDLQLVVHAELPRDPETLLHRSGRTGRAGKKGTAVLVVPASKRRAFERLVHLAKLQLAVLELPTPESILARDQEKLAAEVVALTSEPAEEDLAVARAVLETHGAEALAAALVKQLRSRLPAPEELPESAWLHRKEAEVAARAQRAMERGPRARVEDAPRPPRREKPARQDAASFDEEGSWDAPPVQDAPPRRVPVREDRGAPQDDRRGSPRRGPPGMWYRVNVGRAQGADPRWLVPVICRRGRLEKRDIGSIRILENETQFEVGPWAAGRFEAFAWRPDRKDPGIRFAPCNGDE
jgi:ATP-dependent RNA helicase DeaD